MSEKDALLAEVLYISEKRELPERATSSMVTATNLLPPEKRNTFLSHQGRD